MWPGRPIAAVSRIYCEVDDTDGAIGDVASALAEAHLDACRAACPGPAQTADWLVEHLLGDLNNAADIALSEYEDVLGKAGLARVHELVVTAWRANPKCWAEKHLMEQLTRAEGSPDALIAVHAADLAPSGATHLVIARELERAGHPAEALEWAERGLRESDPDRGPDQHLVDFVCERYTRSGRPADVVVVRRDVLRRRRTLASYQDLRTAARGADRWDEPERAQALNVLRADSRPRKCLGPLGSVLVDALLDDGDNEAAWKAATDGYADYRQWLTLADRSRDTRPVDSLSVYLRLIGPLLTRTGDAAYEQLTELLLSVRACHQALGAHDTFTDYMASLRTTQKRKRKLMALLDGHGL
ncbi:hypothetical protein GCM10010336_12680 [Streptomyces goshikiensis]|nr:hypothetical protein GCM10010336_12680 [Streptomyces goshikiensis]